AASGAQLERRRPRLRGLPEELDRRAPRAAADLLARAVHGRLRGRLLPVLHHAVDQRRHELALVDGVHDQGARLDLCAARHYELFFAPYFERACLRSATPEASSAARITL